MKLPLLMQSSLIRVASRHLLAEAFRRRKRQRGKARSDRKRRYQHNRSKIKRQSQAWRRHNKSRLKRYQRKYRQNPNRYHMRKAADMVPLDIPFVLEATGAEGTIFGFSADTDTLHVGFEPFEADESIEFDPEELLGYIVIPDEEDEAELLALLDNYFDSGTDSEDVLGLTE